MSHMYCPQCLAATAAPKRRPTSSQSKSVPGQSTKRIRLETEEEGESDAHSLNLHIYSRHSLEAAAACLLDIKRKYPHCENELRQYSLPPNISYSEIDCVREEILSTILNNAGGSNVANETEVIHSATTDLELRRKANPDYNGIR